MEERGYRVIRLIGQGGQGRIYDVSDSEGRNLVIKQMPWMGKDTKEVALREVRLLSSLRHPCIVPYLDSFLSRSTPSSPDEDVLCLVMSRCEHDLRQECGQQKQRGAKFEEGRVLSWLAQICWGLQHLHARKFLHRDLKPQNVLLTQSGRVLIADFGVAGQVEHSQDMRHSVVGTPSFMSPEMLEGRPYGFKTDQWALGCVLYEIMVLDSPFAHCKSYAAVVTTVLHCAQPFREPSGYSQHLNHALMSLVRRKPHDRPSNTELLRSEVLRPAFHAFLQSLESAAMASACERTASLAHWMRGCAGPSTVEVDPDSPPAAALRPVAISGRLRRGQCVELDAVSYTSDFDSFSGGSTLHILKDALDDSLDPLGGAPLRPLSAIQSLSCTLQSDASVERQEQTLVVNADLGAGEWRQLLAEAEALIRSEPEDDDQEEAKVRRALGDILGTEGRVERALAWLAERQQLGETAEADELMLQVEVLDFLGDEGLHALPLLERLATLEAHRDSRLPRSSSAGKGNGVDLGGERADLAADAAVVPPVNAAAAV